MLTDRVADAMTRVRNGLSAGHDKVKIPHSRLVENTMKVLSQAGYLGPVEVEADSKSPAKKSIIVSLAYKKDGKPRITHMKRVSKPSHRVYIKTPERSQVRNGLGLNVLSTSTGILTDAQAHEKKVGGEVLLEIW